MFTYYKPEDFRTLRKITNASQQALADMVGVTKQTVSNYETGRFVSNKPVAICLSMALDELVKKHSGAMAYATLCKKIEV